jgi:hypothetical protein
VIPAVLLLRRYLTAAARRLTFMITVTLPQLESGRDHGIAGNNLAGWDAV